MSRLALAVMSTALGIVGTILAFGVVFGLPESAGDKVAKVLLQPLTAIVLFGPGGKEDPLLLLFGIPAQVVTYPALIYAGVRAWEQMRRPANAEGRQEHSGND